MIRDRPSDFEAKDLRSPLGTRERNWWGARCRHCRMWVSKFDENPEMSLQNAAGTPHHDCDGPHGPRQETLPGT